MHGEEVDPWSFPELTALAHLGRYTQGMIMLPEHAPGTLREQSFRVYQRFHGYTSSSRAEFPPEKCSRGKLNELENAPSWVLTRAKRAWSVLREQNPSCVSVFEPSWSGWESQTVTRRIVGPARRVTKLSKKSDPASRVTLIFVSHVNSSLFL